MSKVFTVFSFNNLSGSFRFSVTFPRRQNKRTICLQYLALQVPYRVLVKAETFQKDKDNLARMAKVSLVVISSKSHLCHRDHCCHRCHTGHKSFTVHIEIRGHNGNRHRSERSEMLSRER
jgi:hypothetical protein